MKTPIAALPAVCTASLTVSAAGAAHEADVVVVAATPAGVAAAVAAARSGASVVLLEESTHVGGIVSAGLTNTDIHRKGAVGGLFAEFVRRVRDHSVTTYGADSGVQEGGRSTSPPCRRRSSPAAA